MKNVVNPNLKVLRLGATAAAECANSLTVFLAQRMKRQENLCFGAREPVADVGEEHAFVPLPQSVDSFLFAAV